jgi:hypothetical protein
MHFATVRQLAAMILAWALFLIAYDQHKNPRSLEMIVSEFEGSSIRPRIVSVGDTPRVRLSFSHLCCAKGLEEVRAAVQPLAWLGPARADGDPPASGDGPGAASEFQKPYNIDFDILELADADFVALDRALRSTSLVPDRIEVSGMGHFRLELQLPHLCCTVCSRAVDDQLKRALRRDISGQWVDSMSLDPGQKTVTIYARLNSVVDVLELTRALGQSGFAASSIHVRTSPES